MLGISRAQMGEQLSPPRLLPSSHSSPASSSPLPHSGSYPRGRDEVNRYAESVEENERELTIGGVEKMELKRLEMDEELVREEDDDELVVLEEELVVLEEELVVLEEELVVLEEELVVLEEDEDEELVVLEEEEDDVFELLELENWQQHPSTLLELDAVTSARRREPSSFISPLSLLGYEEELEEDEELEES
jgi:hypothetical protein